jgi:anti-sigma factor RsiW
MNCQETIDVMGEAVEDRLPESLRSGFEEHLAECPSCHIYFEHLRLTRRALRFVSPERTKSPRRNDLIRKFRSEFESGEN